MADTKPPGRPIRRSERQWFALAEADGDDAEAAARWWDRHAPRLFTGLVRADDDETA